MKKILTFIIFLTFILGIDVYADTTTYESGIFKYVIQDNGIRITSCFCRGMQ